MKLNKFLFILVFIPTCFGANPSFASLQLGVGGSFLSTTANVSTTASYATVAGKPESTYGGGVLLFWDAPALIGVEIGAMYVQRKATSDISVLGIPLSQSETVTDLQIPILLRANILPFPSVGVGISQYIAQGQPNQRRRHGHLGHHHYESKHCSSTCRSYNSIVKI